MTDDVLRICMNNSGGEDVERPTEFVITKDTDILELRRRPAPVTELEGHWHLVSATDKSGRPVEVSPANVSFRKDRYTYADQDFQIDRRIEVYPDNKEIRFFADGNDAYSESRYLLDCDQLTIADESQQRVYARGHVALPKSIPAAT